MRETSVTSNAELSYLVKEECSYCVLKLYVIKSVKISGDAQEF